MNKKSIIIIGAISGIGKAERMVYGRFTEKDPLHVQSGRGFFYELICVIGFEFFFVELFGIDGAPGVDDVGEYEGHQQRDVEHRGQREFTRAGVLERQ